MPTLIIGAVLGFGVLLWGGVSCIQDGANARYEANSLAKAGEVKDADIAFRDELLAEKTEQHKEDRKTAKAEKEAIASARDREAARADTAEESASEAWAIVDEMGNVECPVFKPERFCRWDCVRPLLD